jgi:hypothetical protein
MASERFSGSKRYEVFESLTGVVECFVLVLVIEADGSWQREGAKRVPPLAHDAKPIRYMRSELVTKISDCTISIYLTEILCC